MLETYTNYNALSKYTNITVFKNIIDHLPIFGLYRLEDTNEHNI